MITLRGKKETTISNVYIPPTSSRAEEDWTQQLNSLPTGRRCIIAGDLNAHGDWDEFQDADERGSKIEDWMMGKSLQTANDTKKHTRSNPATGGLSSPDVPIASEDVVEIIRENWTTIDDLGSDHLPILFTVDGDKVTRRGKPPLK